MIKGFKFEGLKRGFFSLRVRFVAVFILATILAVGSFFLANSISMQIINNVYLSEDNKAKREEQYHKSLQEYIDDNGITFENIDKVSQWQKKNQYVYLMIYKEQTDDEAFFIPDDMVDKIPKEDEENIPGEKPNEPTPEPPSEDVTPPTDDPTGGDGTEGGVGDGDIDTETDGDTGDGGKEDGKGDTGGEEDDKPGGTIGGITVDLPTKSELEEAAKKLDMLFIELPENQYVYAKFAEYTEYLYYDISNLASIAFGVVVMLAIFLVYMSRLTARISRLGAAVDKVAMGDSEREISATGKDEIARLADNVERMRSTMVENYKKEKEALASNTELITSMSHDIRTPLTVLLGYMDVMRAEAEDNERMQEYIKAAENTAMRLKKLSDDMFGYFLVFGKGEGEVLLEEYDASTLLGQMIFEHVLLMRENGYTADISLDEKDLVSKNVRVDAQSLVRIFDNVFSNIYKYADREFGVKIAISTTPCEVNVRFENKIKTDVEKVESNGIGLKTCKKLAENMGAIFNTELTQDTFIVNISLQLCKGTSEKDN